MHHLSLSGPLSLSNVQSHLHGRSLFLLIALRLAFYSLALVVSTQTTSPPGHEHIPNFEFPFFFFCSRRLFPFTPFQYIVSHWDYCDTLRTTSSFLILKFNFSFS